MHSGPARALGSALNCRYLPLAEACNLCPLMMERIDAGNYRLPVIVLVVDRPAPDRVVRPHLGAMDLRAVAEGNRNAPAGVYGHHGCPICYPAAVWTWACLPAFFKLIYSICPVAPAANGRPQVGPWEASI
jgi:hypothetical protein